MTTTAPTPAWYDSHANLYTLAEWIRSNHGWAFCEKNLIDVLEKPWKWEREWRLASGAVSFVLVERPRDLLDDPLDPDLGIDTQCAWCDAAIGPVAYESEFGPEVDWVTVWRDTNSSDFACDECAGSAANFKAEPVADEILSVVVGALPGLPTVTDEMRTQFKAFGHIELFPVLITKDVQTELGNVLIEEGSRTWGSRNVDPLLPHGGVSVWTAHTHYAGVKTSSIPVDCFIRLAGAAVTL